MDVKVHVEGWKGSGAVKRGEKPDAMLHGVLEVDGVMLEEAGRVEVVFGGGEIVTVKAHLTPGSFEVVPHDEGTWAALLQRCNAQRNARAEGGSGRLVAVKRDSEPG